MDHGDVAVLVDDNDDDDGDDDIQDWPCNVFRATFFSSIRAPAGGFDMQRAIVVWMDSDRTWNWLSH